MEQIDLAKDVKLLVKENVLAVFCDNALKTVSSAVYNGGHKQVKAVLNVGVPEGYSDRSLHLDPLKLITSSAAKLGVTKDYLSMVTAAKISNYSLATKKTSDFSVSVIATAGCQHGESSGEQMEIPEIFGTINIIVFIDADPLDSCMVAALITATEAKSTVLRDLDLRSRYSGDSATGSITDSVTVASNGVGKHLVLAGPASKVGKAIGLCTKQAVREALLKQEPFWATRTVLDRLKERHLPIEKLAAELSKIDGLAVSPEELAKILQQNTQAKTLLLAAAKMDDDYKKNLLPTDLPDWAAASEAFCGERPNLQEHGTVDLPPFIKAALTKIVKSFQQNL